MLVNGLLGYEVDKLGPSIDDQRFMNFDCLEISESYEVVVFNQVSMTIISLAGHVLVSKRSDL